MNLLAKNLLLAVFFLSSSIANAQLVIATYQYADNNRISNIEPLAKVISQELNMNVSTKSYPTVHELIAAILNEEVDVAVINTFGYMLAENSSKQLAMTPIVTWKQSDTVANNYKCVIVSARKSAVRDLQILQKRSHKLNLLLVSKGSTSGNLIPRMALGGIAENKFRSVSYGGTHQSTAEKVAKGLADIGALGSTAYFDYIRQYPNSLNPVWISPEIPLGPVLVKNSLSSDTKNKLNVLMKELHLKHESAFDALKKGWTEALHAEYFIETSTEYYKTVFDQLGNKDDLNYILKTFL